MKNAMQLKSVIKNISNDKHISAQLVMQNFMLERLLERISCSKYRQNFILKGGFLIAAMVGLNTRATMDMDATIKGWPVNSDRGMQYVSREYKHVTANMQCSYSKNVYPWGNACMESFHSLLKREWLNRFKIRDYEHAYCLVFEYLEAFYNIKRIYSYCDYMSPNDYEELHRRLQQDKELTAS